MRKTKLTTEAATSATNGKKRGSETVDDAPGTDMEAGTREDGPADAGKIRIGEIVNGRPVTRSGSRTALRPWTGKASLAMVEV